MRRSPSMLVALALGSLVPIGYGLVSTTPARAQDEGQLPAAFTSDRPGFCNTTQVAAQGRLTTELGALATIEDTPTGQLPRLRLRFGLLEWLEARAQLPSGVARFDSGADVGLSDPWLGIKVGGQLAEGVLLGADFEVSLPLATDDFGAPEANFFAGIQLDWNFWGPLTLTPNAVATVNSSVDPMTGETLRTFGGGGSLKLTWQIIDVLGIFVQSYVLKGEQTDWRVQVGGGLFWRVAPNVQVDAGFDAAVTEQGDPPTAQAGTTILW